MPLYSFRLLCVFWGSNIDPHACMAGTSVTKWVIFLAPIHHGVLKIKKLKLSSNLSKITFVNEFNIKTYIKQSPCVATIPQWHRITKAAYFPYIALLSPRESHQGRAVWWPQPLCLISPTVLVYPGLPFETLGVSIAWSVHSWMGGDWARAWWAQCQKHVFVCLFFFI